MIRRKILTAVSVSFAINALIIPSAANSENEPPPPALRAPISVYNNWSSYDELSDNIPLTETLAMKELDELLRLKRAGVRFDYYMMDAFWFAPDGGYRTWRKPNCTPATAAKLSKADIKERNAAAFREALRTFRHKNPEAVLIAFNGFGGDLDNSSESLPFREPTDLRWLEVFQMQYTGDPRPSDVPSASFWRSMDIYSDHMVRRFEQLRFPLERIDSTGFMVGRTGTIYYRGMHAWKGAFLLMMARGGWVNTIHGNLELIQGPDVEWMARAQGLFFELQGFGRIHTFGRIPGDIEPYGFAGVTTRGSAYVLVNPTQSVATIVLPSLIPRQAPVTNGRIQFRDAGFVPHLNENRITLGPGQMAMVGFGAYAAPEFDFGIQDDVAIPKSIAPYPSTFQSAGKGSIEANLNPPDHGVLRIVIREETPEGFIRRTWAGGPPSGENMGKVFALSAIQNGHAVPVRIEYDKIVWIGMSWAVGEIETSGLDPRKPLIHPFSFIGKGSDHTRGNHLRRGVLNDGDRKRPTEAWIKSMRKTNSFLLASALLASALASSQAPQMTLRDGDRIVFYGDSITAQRLYTRFVEDFVLTRYPNLHVTFFNAGVPGDTVNGGYTGDRATRLKRDLFPHEPSVVTIMLGMNDGYYVSFNPKYLKIYEDGYGDLIRAIGTQAPTARITLISSTPYDEVTHGTEFPHYNDVVSRHAAFVKDLATSSHFAFSDFNKTVSDLLLAANRRNPELASLLVSDRIHPGEPLHWAMAAELARSWGLSPIVSDVLIDAAQARVTRIQRSKVEHLAQAEGALRWIQTDDALPLPLPLYDRLMQMVIELSPLTGMDQEVLQVDHLPAASYILKIDNRVIATFTREQLAAGVNLALFSTPMQDQARDVDGIALKRTRIDETDFIMFREDPKSATGFEVERKLVEKNVNLLADEQKAALPKSHKFELTPR